MRAIRLQVHTVCDTYKLGHHRGVGPQSFIKVANNAHRPAMCRVYGKFGREIVDSLDARVGVEVPPLAEDMPLLSINSMDAGVFDFVFTNVVEAVEYDFPICFCLKSNRAPAVKVVTRAGNNVRTTSA
jgi:hypothetical protein